MATQEKSLLILVANPSSTEPLKYDREIKNIQGIFEKAHTVYRLNVITELSVDWRTLQSTLSRHKPAFVHYIGHSDRSGLILEGIANSSELDVADNEYLSQLFGMFAECIVCVFLNSCDSYVLAEALSKKIEFAIGIRGEVKDTSAIEFSIAFYDAISQGEQIERAYNLARIAFERCENGVTRGHPSLFKRGAKIEFEDDVFKVSPSRLPSLGVYFEGRDDEMRTLTDAWKNGKTNVCVLEAWGGVGKTALASRWRAWMLSDSYDEIDQAFDWSFHRQGKIDNTPYSSDDFVDYALQWFRVPIAADASPEEKGRKLARAIQKSKTLLILDGVEVLMPQ
ncbi:MAG: hypothetical protein LUH55_03345 [Bacteroides thetaiotaomicron]|nr:hypothetical protein [Bacteroides thetaiotaomicron]